MNKSSVSTLIKSTQKFMGKHSPEILTAIGIVGMVSAVISAAKATPKAMKRVEAEKQKQKVDKLTPMQTVKATWKCYAPTAVMCATSAACLVGANTKLLKRNAALATAYKLSETALAEYKDKVTETIGEKKEQAIQEQVEADRVANSDLSSSKVVCTGKGNTLCREAYTGQFFRSDVEQVKRAINYFNNELNRYSYGSLNELFDKLDIDHSDVGDYVGWRADKGVVEPHFSSCLKDGEPCLVVRFDPRPEYGFDSSY